VSTECEPSL